MIATLFNTRKIKPKVVAINLSIYLEVALNNRHIFIYLYFSCKGHSMIENKITIWFFSQ